MRPPEPDFVRQWREAIRTPHTTKNPPIPKCCHTCWCYDKDGFCQHYQDHPPPDFAARQDACEWWVDELPF